MSDCQVTTTSPANRYGSFSGIRDSVNVKFFVDGEDYFAAVADALDGAKETIFIEDWWLSPQIYLRRPHMGKLTWRLDQVLERKAKEGVKVYVVLYKEMSLALNLNSKFSKDWLQNLHPNIKVQRHPDHIDKDAKLFWAHHEKMVIVDSKVAFVGGLDLCFGRFDNMSHRLADPTGVMWPGQDYNNARAKDFVDVDQYDVTLVDRQMTPRMPWHDVSLRLDGLAALDVARHFCERWNFVKKEKAAADESIQLIAPSAVNAERRTNDRHASCRVQVCRSSCEWSSGIPTEHSIQNAYIDLIAKAEHFIYIENQFFVSNPVGADDYVISNKIAYALVQRILRAVSEGKRFRVIVAMPLMPAFEAAIDSPAANSLRLVMHHQYATICRGEFSIFGQLLAKGVNPTDYIRFYGLRNYDLIRDKSHYPRGEELLKQVEQKEHAEFQAKEEAKHHFHHYLPQVIQDLFWAEEEKVQPVVAAAGEGVDEATRDLEDDALFVTELLYIHTKLMIVDDRYAICGSANINDRSLCGDRDSEIAVIIEDTETVDSRMNGKSYRAGRVPHQLRCKLFGEHLGLLPEAQMARMYMNGPQVKPNAKHLALFDRALDAVNDPLSDEFWALWTKTAKNNTEIFRKLFHCVPDDTVTTWDELKTFVPDPVKVLPGHVVDPNLNRKQIQSELHHVSGHLVEFPTEFLCKEVLRAERFSAENLMPEDVFT